jgi:hypothetical protein
MTVILLCRVGGESNPTKTVYHTILVYARTYFLFLVGLGEIFPEKF